MDLKSIKNKLNALQTQGQKKEKVDYSKYLWKPKQEGKFQIRIVPSKLDKNNIPVYTELILGLPGETVESWKEAFWKIFRDSAEHR